MRGDASVETGSRVLVVTSDADRAASLEAALGDVAPVDWVRTADAALSALFSDVSVAAVVSDADLGDPDGVALLAAVRMAAPSLPVVVVFESFDPELVGRALAGQVTDVHVWHDDETDAGRVADLVEGALANDTVESTVTKDPRVVLESADRAFVVVQEGRAVYANRHAREVFQIDDADDLDSDAESLLGGPARSLVVDEEPVRAGQTTAASVPGRMVSDVVTAPVALSAVRTRWEGAPAVSYCFDDDVLQSELLRRKRRLDQYRQSVESSTDLLAAVDSGFRFLFANGAYRSFHGMDADDVRGRHLRSVIGAAAFERIEADLRRALSGETIQLEHRRARGDGDERVLDVRFFPLYDGERVVGIGASMRDVTTDRQRLRELERLAEFRRLVATIADRLTRGADRDAALEAVADDIASSDLFTCTYLVLTDDHGVEFACSAETAVSEDVLRSIHTTEYVTEVRERGRLEMADVTTPPYVQHVADKPSHAGVGLAIEHEGTFHGVLTVHLPTGETLGEVELRLLDRIADDLGRFLYTHSLGHELRTFQEIADQIEDPILLQNLDGEYELVNEAVGEYAAVPPADLLGQDEAAFMDDEVARQIARRKREVLETESAAHYVVRPTFPEHGTRTFSTFRYPHYDEDGDLDGTVAICRDVTESEERDRQVRVMDRVLRHNVSNQMNVVLGYAETIRETTTDDEIARYADRIVESGEALVATTQKEREITKLLSEPPESRTVALSTVVRDAVAEVRREFPDADIAVTVPGTCSIRTNIDLGLAVSELVRNAVAHSDHDEPAVSVSLDRTEQAVTVTVADDGPGIPGMERSILADEMDVEPLYHGSGLGLWLVKLAVDRAEGTVDYAERDPRGSVVTIRLPTD